MILLLKTNQPEAQLYLYEAGICVDQYQWLAHRELSITILTKIDELLAKNHTTLKALTGIVVFEGPGSFTGLRIGVTVANTLAYSFNTPIVGSSGEAWIQAGLTKLAKQQAPQVVMPRYGAPVRITTPRK